MKNSEPWEVDGQFSMELFRAFSSMYHDKGLPKDEVKKLLSWPEWKGSEDPEGFGMP
ncbi:hypothetical protein [Endozoicomonas sp. 2B-B]